MPNETPPRKSSTRPSAPRKKSGHLKFFGDDNKNNTQRRLVYKGEGKKDPSTCKSMAQNDFGRRYNDPDNDGNGPSISCT